MTESSFEVQENFLLIGNKGSYLVEKFLGEGTFGKVAKCKNLSTNKDVAIKIIKNGFDNAGENELKALIEISKLDADEYNLVKCVDVFLYKSHVCIVFEILDQSLYDFLEDRRFRPLFVQEIRAIAWQLLIALKGLKSINLVHCDIKLDNIMLVNQDSKPFRVKLIDFGLASKTKDIPTGTRLQNICFRAPEVILGLPLDERLDMWTVGYVLALSFDDLKNMYHDQKKMTEMLEVDPNKRISPNDALRHPFFKLEKKEPKTTKPQEPAVVEVHQQPEAKEVTSVPHGPAANPQERSSNNNKTSLVQQQKAEKRKNPAASRKRKNSHRQSQDRENRLHGGAVVSALASQQDGPRFKSQLGDMKNITSMGDLSVWSLHVLPMHASVLLLPPSKNVLHRLIGNSKLSIGVSVRVNGCVIVDILPCDRLATCRGRPLPSPRRVQDRLLQPSDPERDKTE
uniref:Protein kinase domain-containing protein n=1 Tax=Oryzias latipes TaxID=8090 RepID=A0A3P9JMU6_ORYLA